ncbi:MAG: DUF1810 domain-containing protein [Acidimicrobiales bacterium]
MTDPFDLQRFVDAQDADGIYEAAVRELSYGRKRSHWMWFVFPQITGLGHSATANRYALSGLDEARAYLAHPVLGPRLLECVRILVAAPDRNPVVLLGATDAQKLQSSMTLFDLASPAHHGFATVLDLYFGSEPDLETISRV